MPKVTNYVGSCVEIAKKKFNRYDIDTFEELKELCKDVGIEVESRDTEIYQKFTGPETNNFNYWSN